MLVLTGIAIVALAIVSVIMTNQKTDPSLLTVPRPSLPALGIQIVCGDCSGEGILPRRTLLDGFGNCSECGGSSYILASALYSSKRALAMRRPADLLAVRGKILPFKVDQTEKIAV